MVQIIAFLLCLVVVRAQLFLQLSGAEDLPSIPLPLDNQQRPVVLCTDSHPITVRCDETIKGSTRATFFVNDVRFHMEFYKDYYISRNKDNISRPWYHPQGLTKVECRLDNKERFTTFILFKCESSADSSAKASIAPSSTSDPIATPVFSTEKPKQMVPTASTIPSFSKLPSISASPSSSLETFKSTLSPTPYQNVDGPTQMPQAPSPLASTRAVISAVPMVSASFSVSNAPSTSSPPNAGSKLPSPSASVTVSSSTSIMPSSSTSVKPTPSTSSMLSPSASVTPSPSTSNMPSPSRSISPSPSSSNTPLSSTSVSPSPLTSKTAPPSTSITPSPSMSISTSASPSATPSSIPIIIPTPTSSVSSPTSPTPTISSTSTRSPSSTPSAVPTLSESMSTSVPSRSPDDIPQQQGSPVSSPVSAADIPISNQEACVVIDSRKTISGTYGNGWEVENDGSLVYNKEKESLTLTDPGKAVLKYRFSVPVEGHFSFVLDSRSKQWTEYNDVYVRLQPGGFRFMRNGKFNPGVQGKGWLKVFQNDYSRSFSTKAISHNAHSLSTAARLVPGQTYRMDLSGRSNRFAVYRIIMFPCEDKQCQQSSKYWEESINRCLS